MRTPYGWRRGKGTYKGFRECSEWANEQMLVGALTLPANVIIVPLASNSEFGSWCLGQPAGDFSDIPYEGHARSGLGLYFLRVMQTLAYSKRASTLVNRA